MSLARLGFSPAEFEALTRTLLGQQVLETGAGGLAPAPPGMGPRIAQWQGERRAVSAVTLPLSAAPDPGPPPEAAIAAQYTAHEAAYVEPERRSGRYLEVDVRALADAAAPDEAAVEAYYAANRAGYGQPASRVIDQLSLTPGQAAEQAGRVRSGAITYDDLARELGEDPAALDLGRVQREDLPEATAEAVFAASEPGIVGPVEAPFGPVLIRIRAVTEEGATPLETVREEIAARLAREQALQEAPQLANRIEDMRAAGASPEEIAAVPGITLSRFELIARDGTLPGGKPAEGLMARPVFLEEAFAALDHEEREIVETPEGGYFVLVVERIVPSALNPLEAVRERVIADWQRAERIAALSREAEREASGLTAQALAGFAAERGLEVTEHPAFARERAPQGLSPRLVASVFDAQEGAVLTERAPDGEGVILAGVTAVEPLEPEALGRLSERVEREIAALIADDARELFARAVTASYPIELDETVIDEVFNLIGAARTGG